jgi:hypothetical protein
MDEDFFRTAGVCAGGRESLQRYERFERIMASTNAATGLHKERPQLIGINGVTPFSCISQSPCEQEHRRGMMSTQKKRY